MATQVATAARSSDEAQHPREPARTEKGFLEAWLEYLKFLTVAAGLGAALLVGPVVAALALAYAAYLLSRFFGS